jgi:hypothetical protein
MKAATSKPVSDRFAGEAVLDQLVMSDDPVLVRSDLPRPAMP